MKVINQLVIFIFVCAIISCKEETPKSFTHTNAPVNWDASSLIVKDTNGKKVRGQVLYLPIYSNIPYYRDTIHFDLSGLVAIHNTDFDSEIIITKVLFFNTEGKLVYDFLQGKPKKLNPLGTDHFYVPYEDKSGIGANFIVEWTSDSLVNEPLIETIMFNLRNLQSIAFLSQGKVLRETK